MNKETMYNYQNCFSIIDKVEFQLSIEIFFGEHNRMKYFSNRFVILCCQNKTNHRHRNNKVLLNG